MSEDTPDSTSTEALHSAFLDILETPFPNISRMPIDLSFLKDPNIKKLVNLIKFSIPAHTYQTEILNLYDSITEIYYDYVYKNQLQAMKTELKANVSLQQNKPQQNNQVQNEPSEKPSYRKKINYLDLAKFIESFTPEQEIFVNQEVIRQGQRFDSWESKEIKVAAFKDTPKKPKDKYEKVEFTFAKQKVLKGDNTINITIGKNISRQVHEMKKILIKRAQSNRLLQENPFLTEIQKVEAEVNFILNRITQEYFEDFLNELHPYAMHELYSLILSEKIIEKVLEEHNFIKLYSKLIKGLKGINVEYADKAIKFKVIFIEKLQCSFYRLIRKRQWADREELYKKQLLGFSYFIGQLIHNKILSKYAFPDIFFELISSFIHQYRQNKSDKNFYYHQTYVECIIKIIQNMGDKYENLMQKEKNTNISSICDTIQALCDEEEANFTQICDFIEILKEINKRMPSQRFKISFLLQDFRCSKAIKKETAKQQNKQYQIMKEVLAIDHSSIHDVKKIHQMISKCDPNIIMKDYYFQFAQGNAKHLTKNIETFKMFMNLPKILDSALQAFKENLSDLYMIESDFPFLVEGLAKIMKQVCDDRKCDWKLLNLTDPDEDIMEFIQRVQAKYYKMIMQD